jgi:hypothetical protein
MASGGFMVARATFGDRTIAQKYNVILAGAPDLEIEITSEMVEAGA